MITYLEYSSGEVVCIVLRHALIIVRHGELRAEFVHIADVHFHRYERRQSRGPRGAGETVDGANDQAMRSASFVIQRVPDDQAAVLVVEEQPITVAW
jgi:hypothetical protein